MGDLPIGKLSLDLLWGDRKVPDNFIYRIIRFLVSFGVTKLKHEFDKYIIVIKWISVNMGGNDDYINVFPRINYLLHLTGSYTLTTHYSEWRWDFPYELLLIHDGEFPECYDYDPEVNTGMTIADLLNRMSTERKIKLYNITANRRVLRFECLNYLPNKVFDITYNEYGSASERKMLRCESVQRVMMIEKLASLMYSVLVGCAELV
jgi:hypothetical protein